MEDAIPEPATKPAGTYRLFSKAHLITYPRTDLPLQETFDQLRRTHEGQYKYIVLGRELHQDGYPHLHLFIHYKEKKDVKDARAHYGLGQRDAINIRDCDSPFGAMRYCKKHGTYLEDGDPPPEPKPK